MLEKNVLKMTDSLATQQVGEMSGVCDREKKIKIISLCYGAIFTKLTPQSPKHYLCSHI